MRHELSLYAFGEKQVLFGKVTLPASQWVSNV